MSSKILLDSVEIHLDSRELVVRGEVKRLPWRAFDFLLVLAENPGEVVSKEQLLKSVWGGLAVDESNLTQAVAQIRKAMGETHERKSYIETLPRIGYRITPGAVIPANSSPVVSAPSGPIVPETPGQDRPRRWGLAGFVLLLAGVAALAAVLFQFKRSQPGAEAVEVPFTALDGEELSGSFSPDGREVAFTWTNRDGVQGIYLKAIDSGTVRPFVVSGEKEMGPVFSPDSRSIAFLRLGLNSAAIIVKPRDGGPERAIKESQFHTPR